MSIKRSKELLNKNNRLFQDLWDKKETNTYHVLKMIDNYINQYGEGWAIRSGIEMTTTVVTATAGQVLAPFQSYLPSWSSVWSSAQSYLPERVLDYVPASVSNPADFNSEVILRALQSDEGKDYLKDNVDAILEVILEEHNNLKKGNGIISIITQLAAYIYPAKTYLERHAEWYMYMKGYRGLTVEKDDFINYMSKVPSLQLIITSWCKQHPGVEGINEKQYADVVTNAIYAAQFKTDNFHDNMNEVRAQYVTQAINVYLSRNNYSLVNEREVLILITQFKVREVVNGEVLVSDEEYYGSIYDKLTNKQPSIWTVDAMMDFVPSLAAMSEDNIQTLVREGIQKFKSSYQSGGVPSGVAFSADNLDAWPANGDTRYCNNFTEPYSKTTIIDALAESIPAILPLFKEVDKDLLVNLANAINDKSVDNMRHLFSSIIALLRSKQEVAAILGQQPHVGRIAKLILGEIHASNVMNNFGPDRLKMLGYEVNGQPLLQSLQPLLSKLLGVALTAEDSDLYDNIHTLLTSLHTDVAEGSAIPALLEAGFTRDGINEIVACLPDVIPEGGIYPDTIQAEYSKKVLANRIDLSEDDANNMARECLSNFQKQKAFQNDKVNDIYKSIENILGNDKVQNIGEEIPALHTIMQVINNPNKISFTNLSEFGQMMKNVSELRQAIHTLSEHDSLLPLVAFIADNRKDIKHELSKHLHKGHIFTQHVICPLLCVVDTDIATALRTGKINRATKLESLLRVLPAVAGGIFLQVIKLVVILPFVYVGKLLYSLVSAKPMTATVTPISEGVTPPEPSSTISHSGPTPVDPLIRANTSEPDNDQQSPGSYP